MLTVALPDELEAAVVAAAQRLGLSVDEYLADVCSEALTLDVDRARLQSFLDGTPCVMHERTDAWLADFSVGKRSACRR
jgi:hypothetical protein